MTDLEHSQMGKQLNWDQGNNLIDSGEELLEDNETNSAKLSRRSRIRALAGEPVHLLITKTSLCSKRPAGDLKFQKMFYQVIFQNETRSWDENLSLTLKINFKNDVGIQEECILKTSKIKIRGAHPCQIGNRSPISVITLNDEKDEMVNVEEITTVMNATSVNSSEVDGNATHSSQEEGKPTTPLEPEGLCAIPLLENGQPTTASESVGNAKTLIEQALLESEIRGDRPCQIDYPSPSSVITLNDGKDEMVNVEGIATVMNATSVNSSEVDGNATHSSQEEGKPTTLLEPEGLCAIPLLEDGQPTTASESVGKTKTLKVHAQQECDIRQESEIRVSCQIDNRSPSSVITLSDEKDEVGNVEEINTILNVTTSVNSSEVDGNATHPSQEEGKPTAPLEPEGICAIPLLEDGQPTTVSESVGNAKTLIEQALLESEIRGDRPCQIDYPSPSSVITLNDGKDEMVNVEEIATVMNVKTSVNSSEVDGNATHSSQEEGKPTTPLEPEGLCAIPLLEDGQPTTASESVGKTKTLKEHAQQESEGPETKDKVKQLKLGCLKIVSSRNKKQNPTCHQKNDFGTKLNFTTVFFGVLALAGGAHAFKGPENQVVKRAEQAVLPCFSDLGHHVKWFMNRIPIFSGYDWATGVESWYTIADGPSGHYDLSINYTDEKMAGLYTCQQPGELKEITARLIVLDINCSAEETNVTAAVCTAVITGGNVNKIWWEIIHKDGVTNAPGTVVTLIKNDTVDGIQRQKLATALTVTENDLHSNSVCRLTLVFNNTESSAIILGPEEQMADNIPTYTVDIPCNTSKKELVAENPVSKMPESNQSNDFNLYTGMLLFEMAAVVLIMIAGILCGCPYVQVNGNGVILACKWKVKITTLLGTLVTSLYRLIWCVTTCFLSALDEEVISVGCSIFYLFSTFKPQLDTLSYDA